MVDVNFRTERGWGALPNVVQSLDCRQYRRNRLDVHRLWCLLTTFLWHWPITLPSWNYWILSSTTWTYVRVFCPYVQEKTSSIIMRHNYLDNEQGKLITITVTTTITCAQISKDKLLIAILFQLAICWRSCFSCFCASNRSVKASPSTYILDTCRFSVTGRKWTLIFFIFNMIWP